MWSETHNHNKTQIFTKTHPTTLSLSTLYGILTRFHFADEGMNVPWIGKAIRHVGMKNQHSTQGVPLCEMTKRVSFIFIFGHRTFSRYGGKVLNVFFTSTFQISAGHNTIALPSSKTSTSYLPIFSCTQNLAVCALLQVLASIHYDYCTVWSNPVVSS